MDRVMEQQQSIRLESDMYAWNIASAALGLRHTLIDSFMVSDIITGLASACNDIRDYKTIDQIG